jgi:hypothetical protein
MTAPPSPNLSHRAAPLGEEPTVWSVSFPPISDIPCICLSAGPIPDRIEPWKPA